VRQDKNGHIIAKNRLKPLGPHQTGDMESTLPATMTTARRWKCPIYPLRQAAVVEIS